jgi:hypothetical protein
LETLSSKSHGKYGVLRIKVAQSSEEGDPDKINPLCYASLPIIFPPSPKWIFERHGPAHSKISLSRGKIQLQKIPPSELGYSIVVGKSPYGKVDLLLRARSLTLRQKMLNMDTDFLLDLIKLMNKREGERCVPYERRFSLQGPG